jgi:lipoprotein signal peptidase
MKNKLEWQYSIDWCAMLIAVASLLLVLQTFVIGRHFVIPTGVLAVTVVFANLAWCGLQDQRWAKYVLFWLAVLVCCHTFFALFWAKAPRELLGVVFLPIYGATCIASALTAWRYAKSNQLYLK